MNYVFADASYFFAVISPADQWHRAAIEIGSLNNRPMLTTAWILTEVADGLSRTRNRHVASQLYLDYISSPYDKLLEPNTELFEAGLKLYHDRPDKDWSLTDCISFVAMREHGVSDALTGDRHFGQAGFRALLAD